MQRQELIDAINDQIARRGATRREMEMLTDVIYSHPSPDRAKYRRRMAALSLAEDIHCERIEWLSAELARIS